MKITVTREHIENALKDTLELCPIELALKSKGCLHPIVNICGIEFTRLGKEYCVPLSRKLKTFMYRFDDGKPVKPITFTIRGVK